MQGGGSWLSSGSWNNEDVQYVYRNNWNCKRSNKRSIDPNQVFRYSEEDVPKIAKQVFHGTETCTAEAFFVAIPAYDKKEINTFMDLLDIVESEALFTMLKKTDKQLHQIFLLRYYGYEIEEISDLLNIKPDTIYKKIQRFKEKLKKQ